AHGQVVGPDELVVQAPARGAVPEQNVELEGVHGGRAEHPRDPPDGVARTYPRCVHDRAWHASASCARSPFSSRWASPAARPSPPRPPAPLPLEPPEPLLPPRPPPARAS